MSEIEFFVGIDWGAETHRVCVVDAKRTVLAEWSVSHDSQSIAAMVARLLEIAGNAERLAVGIETRWTAVVEGLLERSIRVKCINPKQLDRFRDRHTMAGAKDDRRDAFVLADSIRTDGDAFREVKLGDPRLVELRELFRMHDELGEEQNALAGRLYSQLIRVFPQVLELGSVYRDLWVLALLERAPTPTHVQALSLAKIRTVLNKYGVRKWTPEEVRQTLQKQPLPVAPGVESAAQTHIQMLLPRLSLVNSQMRAVREALDGLLDELAQPSTDPERKEHRDVTVLRSLPGVGTIVGAAMLAEAHEALAARDYHRLRSLCGAAPVTRQSGKSHSTVMRYACNRRLRDATSFMAHTLVRYDPKLKALYTRHPERGHSHGHALRVVTDRALALLIAMLRDGTEYDKTKRAA